MSRVLAPKPPSEYQQPDQHRRMIRDYCTSIGDQYERCVGSVLELGYTMGPISAGVPATGKIHRDAAPGSATELRIHDSDRDGQDQSAFLARIRVGDRLYFFSYEHPMPLFESYEVSVVTDQTTYYQFDITGGVVLSPEGRTTAIPEDADAFVRGWW